MPNIKTFDAGNLRLNPTETGVDATAKTAQRIGMFFNQQASGEQMLASETERLAGDTSRVGSETETLGAQKGADMADTGRRIGSAVSDAGDAAVKYLDHQQISQGAPAFANLMAQKTAQWNDTVKKADPNDPTVAPKFMESLEDDLTKFKDKGFYTEAGQAWAEAHVDALRQHLTETTQADMANKAKEATSVNLQQMENSLSSNVHNDPSKSNLDFSIAAYKSGLEGMISSSPNLNAAQVDHVRGELSQKGMQSLIKANAIGYIEKTAQLPPWLNDPKYAPYVNAAELKTFENAAKAQTKVNDYYDKQNAITQKQIGDQNVHAAATRTINDNVRVDPQTNQVTINPQFFKDALEIARKNPDAPTAGATVRTMLDWGESQQNKERKVVTDPAAASAIDGNMFTSDNPTSKMDILKAEAAGKLTRADAEIRTKIIDQRDKMPADPQFKFAMDGAKELIEGRTAGEKSLQSGKYAAFMQQFLGEYQRQKLAGTLPANALSLRDPNSLLSKTMESYKSPLSAAISGNGGISAAPATPAAASNETPTALRGIASLSYSKSRKIYRDDTTGQLYNADGTKVEK